MFGFNKKKEKKHNWQIAFTIYEIPENNIITEKEVMLPGIEYCDEFPMPRVGEYLNLKDSKRNVVYTVVVEEIFHEWTLEITVIHCKVNKIVSIDEYIECLKNVCDG